MTTEIAIDTFACRPSKEVSNRLCVQMTHTSRRSRWTELRASFGLAILETSLTFLYFSIDISSKPLYDWPVGQGRTRPCSPSTDDADPSTSSRGKATPVCLFCRDMCIHVANAVVPRFFFQSIVLMPELCSPSHLPASEPLQAAEDRLAREAPQRLSHVCPLCKLTPFYLSISNVNPSYLVHR